MIYVIQGLIILAIESYCLTMFVDTFCVLGNRASSFKKIIRYLLLFIISFGCSLYFEKYLYLKVLVILVASSLVFRFFNFQGYIKNIIVVALFFGINFLAEYLALAIYIEIVPNNNEILGIIQPLIVLLAKAFLFFAVLIINRMVDKKTLLLFKDSDWIKLMFFPVFTIILTASFIYKSDYVIEKHLELIMWIIACGLLGIDVFVLIIVRDMAEKEKILREKDIINNQNKNQLLYYEKVMSDIDKQRQISHEYNNKIECIKQLINSDDIEELKAYIEESDNKGTTTDNLIDTNNAIVNAVINTKYHEAVEKGIIFLFNTNNLLNVNLNKEDIVVILANLLNNAIEACESCNRKLIEMKIIYEGEELLISVKNTYNGCLRVANGLYVSSKFDQKNHGFGINNIISSVEKYDGIYSIKYSDSEFVFTIVIPQYTV